MNLKTIRRTLLNAQVAATMGAAGVGLVSSVGSAQQVATSFSFSTRSLSDATGDGQITRTSVKRYADLLGLDEAQREVFDVLFEGYITSYQDARAQATGDMEEVQAEFRDTQDFSLFRDRMPAILSTFREKSAALESQFFGDLRSVLSEEQGERMADVERMRRRETQLSFGVSGASVDLSDVMHDLDVQVVGELGEALRSYELDLDRALVENERNSVAFGGGEVDYQQIQRALGDLHERALRIRDLNRRHARTLATILPEVARPRFERAVLERSFPRVYRTPHAARVLDAALGLDDLTGDQESQLTLVRESYERDLARANERWASEIEKADDEGAGGGMFSGAGGRMMMLSLEGDDESPVAEARKARRELDKRAEDKVRGILSEQQIARLPERRDEEERGVLAPVRGSQVIIRGG